MASSYIIIILVFFILVFIKYNGVLDKKPPIFNRIVLSRSNKTVNGSWWEEEQVRRKLKIKKVCSKLPPQEFQYMRSSFIYDPTHQLFYCKNAKAGTTTWMRHFLYLSMERTKLPDNIKENILKNSTKDRVLREKVSQIFPIKDQKPERLAKNATSFSFVRHPFERLVSAFEDKLVPKYYKDGNITINYPDHYNMIYNTYGNVSFVSFTKFILEINRNCSANCLDIHWKPFHTRCGYCHIPYSIIGKMETFAEDVQHIAEAANLQLDVQHIADNALIVNLTTAQLTQLYFSEMPKDLLISLYNMYKIDFDMFDYDPWKYNDSKDQGRTVSQPV